ncbi:MULTISPECIES: ABC transporter ATP-binding protein [Ligilactobacillus]|uniref:ABC transporter, permease/ATP-binding protein n=1 Tax=Ligilactobacillus animalis TaxID=1605 RepID=A0ABR4RRS1_9LACO|nr:ABC transporter ATP-binding protein [Ligilactobacillus animalis]KDA46729.1 ABC transporter, permease/ATP-binding protein [Ligilactobacillus animalis]MDO5883361.1 ABC transporter ATP-binding protein [Ligilactobacillus animalis]MDQ2233501.1 ABC transporter ATP-binding protein/permease [Ligilactobacillus animalis]MDU1487152.1 ABC transporter ATP-binding protein [Ligilactobacillus animalis]MDU8986284.1 ABC transporter ATP-binding protein [Ligilactobacillus animalis]
MEILKPHLKNYLGAIIGAVISIIVAAGASLLQPRILQFILDNLLKNDRQAMFNYGMILIALAVIGVIAGILNVYFAARVAQGVTSDLREETYRKIQTFSLSNIEKFSASTLVVRLINDMNQVLNVVMTTFMQVLRMPIMIIGAFVLGIVTIPRFWWLQVVMFLAVALVIGLTFPQLGKMFDRFQKKLDRSNTIAKEAMQGIRVIKSFNQQENEEERFGEVSDEMNDLNIKIGYVFSCLLPAFFLVCNVGITAVVYLVGINVENNPGELAAITSYIGYLMQMLFTLAFGGMTMAMYARGFVSLGRIKEVLDTKPDLTFDPNAPEVELDGTVEFDNVSFAYPGAENETLKNISFKVAPGESIGVIGATGSGKSTLAQLMTRLYDPTSGVVKVGGVDLREVNEGSLRKAVSLVLQKALLFSGKISDNLRQGDRNATTKDFRWAARISQAAEFVERYDDQYEHPVEERSANFSGGQKQRLSITRGVVGKPKVLILDDSTSALDAKSEKRVKEALEKELTQTTTFVIAEKIFSVMDADRIMVLDQGQIVALGSHQELLANSQVYREIYETQRAKDKIEEGEL